MKSRPLPKVRYDQNLVADQPGRQVIFWGVALSLILGFGFRGLIAQEKIYNRVEIAAKKIHKDVRVNFESADMSLSHNFLPRLAVEVRNVEMISEVGCWGRPILKVDLLELPVSIFSLIFERQPFKKIVAHQAELRFRSQRTPCSAAEAPVQVSQPKAGITLVKRYQAPEIGVQTSIDTLEIEKLNLQYDPSPQSSFELVDLNLSVKSHRPKIITLTGKTHLIKDNTYQDFVSHGQLSLQYAEEPRPSFQVDLFGNWREGSYSFNCQYDLTDTKLVTTGELKHIPASQVITALKSYGWLREDFDGRRLWVTMKGRSEGLANNWQKIPLTLADIRIEGDLGEIEVDNFHAAQLQPFVFSPLKGRVKNLDLDRFLEFLKSPRTLDFLGHLGQFSGDIELKNENEFKLSGRHKGLEFIFSNRGHREVQLVSHILGDMVMRNNHWDLNLKEIKLNQGQFVGDIKLSADRDFKNLDVKLTATELSLSPTVIKLMSGGGEVAPITSQILAKIKEGKVAQLRGFIRTADLRIDQMHFEKINTQFDLQGDQTQVQISSQTMEIPPSAKAYRYFSQLLAPTETAPAPVRLKQGFGTFNLSGDKEMKWKGVTANYEGKGGRLSSEGQWSTQGSLMGSILVKSSLGTRKWMISGHRDNPELVESNAHSAAGR